MPTLAEAMRSKADEANAMYTLAYVEQFIREVAGQGFYRAGFKTSRWDSELSGLMTGYGFTVTRDDGTTWVAWLKSEEAARA